MGTPVDRSITFAGPGQQPVQLAGRFIRVLGADASGVTLTPHPGSPLLRYAGQDVDAGPGGFQAFDVAVTVASTVQLCVSDTRQADNSTTVTATVSATVSPGGTLSNGGDTACATAVATQLAAGNVNGLSVMVKSSATNDYPLGTVRVGTTGVGAASGIEINPGESLTFDTTAPIFAYNNSNAPIATTVTAASAVITANNTFAADAPVVFAGSFGTVTGLVAGTTYYVSATGLSGTQFEVSAAPGGAPIVPGGSGTANPTVGVAVVLQVLPLAK